MKNVSQVFIERPVMTTLIMVAFVIAGVFGYRQLPVSELPNVDMPTIEVSAALPGADAATMGSTVATPLENQFSRIAGLQSMTSSSSQGSTQISLQFAIDRDIDGAAQDVQSAISSAQGLLPTAMPQPPSFRKSNSSDTPVMILAATSQTLPVTLVDKYVETYVTRRLASIDGVSLVNVMGQRRPAVRVRVDPAALAARGIGIDQVAAAIRASNANLATGALDGSTRSAIIHTDGQLTDASQFQSQIVAYRDGAPVRLRDVATVINGSENTKAFGELSGVPSVIMGVMRQPGSNTVAVSNRIRAELPKIAADLPQSIQLNIEHDRSDSIRQSVSDVRWTLIAAAVLVVGVIFLFLRKVSATIIPSLALPITIVGTFAGMAVLGYSIDNLSLMSLTLAVGFVVDDAIVMLENIVRHVEAGEDPREAALKGSKEVSFTILSMTVSLAAVFIPVLFMGGIVGKLLHEFAATIVLAIVISGIVSITLTPMLCSRFLKGHDEQPAAGRWHVLFDWSERQFERVQQAYARSLDWAMAHRLTIMAAFAASLVATWFFFVILPEDFLPSEDSGMLQVQLQAAPGTSFTQMVEMQKRIGRILDANPNVATTNSAVDGTAGSTSNGRITLILKPRSERESIETVMRQLRPKLAQVPGVRVFMVNPPSIRIGARGSRSQYQYTLYGIDKKVLYDSAAKLQDAVAKVPGIVDVTTDHDDSSPSVNVEIDRDRSAALGISVQQIQTALGAAFGGQQISTIFSDTDQYRVILEFAENFQRNTDDMSRIYLTGNNGALVPLTAVTRLRSGTISLQENHQGQLPAVTLSFNLAPGYALSYATDKITQVQGKLGIPASVTGSFQGTAQAFQDSVSGMGFLLLGAIVVVYIVLGILYESFIHPLTILSGLPAAAVGALLTLWLFNVPLTLYAFVGMVMLVGIVKKNAIMMIDFALERQRGHHIDAATAIREAALVRFRPIMMTTAAALMGTLPIAMGLGAGGEGRQPLGLAVVGGLVLSQLLTLYITPVIYCYLDRSSQWSRRDVSVLVPQEEAH